MTPPAPHGVRGRIATLVEPVVTAAGYDLEEVAVAQAGRRMVVRVVVDADDGMSLDDITDVSRAVSTVLDSGEADQILGRFSYTLEVTSPGVDRPLTAPRHWRRNVGRLVKVRIHGPDGERSVTGRIAATDDEGVALQIDQATQHVPYDRLGPGKVQVEFAPQTASEKIDGVTGREGSPMLPEGDGL